MMLNKDLYYYIKRKSIVNFPFFFALAIQWAECLPDVSLVVGPSPVLLPLKRNKTDIYVIKKII